MLTKNTRFAPTFLRALVVTVASATAALAGCATNTAPDEPATETATNEEALRWGGGGGGGLGFTCENGTCTCSKQIEGDCDKMVINCTGDMTAFENCLKGWLTTDCSCTQAMTTQPTSPIRVVPITAGDFYLSP